MEAEGGIISSIFAFLTDIGFTKESTVPLLVLGLVAYIFFTRKLRECLTPIKFAIVEIQGIFREYGHKIQYSLTETSASPLRPTDFGMTLAKESGLYKLIQEKKEEFLKELDARVKEYKAFSAYDAQEDAIGIMRQKQDSPLMQPVKDYAFKNGVELEPILRVGGLLLRDEYLKQHPELSPKDKD